MRKVRAATTARRRAWWTVSNMSSDISMCTDLTCNKSILCRRFLLVPSRMQAYADFKQEEWEDGCDDFLRVSGIQIRFIRSHEEAVSSILKAVDVDTNIKGEGVFSGK